MSPSDSIGLDAVIVPRPSASDADPPADPLSIDTHTPHAGLALSGEDGEIDWVLDVDD